MSNATTTQAWEASPEPDMALWALEKLGYDDKRVLRLFACWSARQVWHLLNDDRSKTAVEVAERYANGEATENEKDEALDAAWAAARDNDDDWAAQAAAWTAHDDAFFAACGAAGSAAWASACDTAGTDIGDGFDAAWTAAQQAQADELRRVVGNPVAN